MKRTSGGFKEKLNDPNCIFYIAEDTNHQSVGLVRYDMAGNDATISVIVDHNFNGRGYGAHIIARGSEKIFKNGKVEKIHAYILPQNQASVKAFKKANFKWLEDTTVEGQPAKHLILVKKVQT